MKACDVKGGKIVVPREKEGDEREAIEVVWKRSDVLADWTRRDKMVLCFSGGAEPVVSLSRYVDQSTHHQRQKSARGLHLSTPRSSVE